MGDRSNCPAPTVASDQKKYEGGQILGKGENAGPKWGAVQKKSSEETH